MSRFAKSDGVFTAFIAGPMLPPPQNRRPQLWVQHAVPSPFGCMIGDRYRNQRTGESYVFKLMPDERTPRWIRAYDTVAKRIESFIYPGNGTYQFDGNV